MENETHPGLNNSIDSIDQQYDRNGPDRTLQKCKLGSMATQTPLLGKSGVWKLEQLTPIHRVNLHHSVDRGRGSQTGYFHGR